MRDSELHCQEANSSAGGTGISSGNKSMNPSSISRHDDSLCLNCKSNGHFTARCPTIGCERCRKLGHISQICHNSSLGVYSCHVWFPVSKSRFLLFPG
jgi:hypothetical protein